jgi:Beta-lactamase
LDPNLSGPIPRFFINAARDASLPGLRDSASNCYDAYNLIAAIIEIIAQQPFEVYLREQFFKPLGLIHTGFWGPIDHPEVADILHMNSIEEENTVIVITSNSDKYSPNVPMGHKLVSDLSEFLFSQ